MFVTDTSCLGNGVWNIELRILSPFPFFLFSVRIREEAFIEQTYSPEYLWTYQSTRPCLSIIVLDETKALISWHHSEQKHKKGILLVEVISCWHCSYVSFSCLRKILQDITEHPRGAQQFSFPLKELKKNTKRKSLKQNAEGSQLNFANGSRYLKYYQDLCSLAYSSALLWLALIIDSVLGKELLLHLFLLH